VLLIGGYGYTMVEWCGWFWTTAIGNLWRNARHGGAIDHNSVFTWRIFGLPPSAVDNIVVNLCLICELSQ
jgi:hypothetical protein